MGRTTVSDLLFAKIAPSRRPIGDGRRMQFYVLEPAQVQLLNQLSQVWRAEKASPSAYESLRFEVTGQHNDSKLSWWAVPSDEKALVELERMIAVVKKATPTKKLDAPVLAKQGTELVAAIRAVGSRTGR